MITEETYGDKIFKHFFSMKIGEIFHVNELVKSKNREYFQVLVKLFIDTDFGRKSGFYLQPNNNWTWIKKTGY